jgi:hypothetical protein
MLAALTIATLTAVAFAHHVPGHGDESVAHANVDSTFAWLTGHWSNGEGDERVEELWLAPRGGAMLGMHRDLHGGKFVFFEFLRIVEDSAGVAYVAQPKGRAPTRFGLIERGAQRVVFENPAHDYPQRILYWLDDQGRLHARTEGKTAKGSLHEDWVWTREK